MSTDNFNKLQKLFSQVRDRHLQEPNKLNPEYITQLEGQVEESLDLLNDVIEELRTIDPESIHTLKSLTLQIFDRENEI